MSTYRLSFITPLFSRGAYEDRPEIRSASIRGQLHWWFRALGGSAADEKAIFGGVGDVATASRIVVRVASVAGRIGAVNTLPHKGGGQASPKVAFLVGTAFDLQVLTRLQPLDNRRRLAFDRALESWLLLGTLGLRGTRAAGSFRWEATKSPSETGLQPCHDFASYAARCAVLLQGAPLRFALLDQSYSSAEQARCVVSDTLGGRDDHHGQDDLARLNHPLGKIGRGERKTSPLRFRIVSMGDQFRVAAVWDARMSVTGNKPQDLAGIIALLKRQKPALGAQLAASALG